MVLPPVLKVWRFTGWVEERVHEVTDSAVYEMEVTVTVDLQYFKLKGILGFCLNFKTF